MSDDRSDGMGLGNGDLKCQSGDTEEENHRRGGEPRFPRGPLPPVTGILSAQTPIHAGHQKTID